MNFKIWTIMLIVSAAIIFVDGLPGRSSSPSSKKSPSSSSKKSSSPKSSSPSPKSPSPGPGPKPRPGPQPKPGPQPQPRPGPQPGPMPQPRPPRPGPPGPMPQPRPPRPGPPGPMPQPRPPRPGPQPGPEPQPRPGPQPQPRPGPQPGPEPQPDPQPDPEPTDPPSSPPSGGKRPPSRPPPRSGIKLRPPGKPAKGDSPLVFDMDQDGVISAVKGIGVNMNSHDHKIRNGAASGGDKMLAICDFSGNGEIDYREVFGDGTVDPFTGTHLNAANGFIALKQVAFSAMNRFADLKIVKWTQDNELLVNVQKLRLALKRIQCDLGFISGHNVHTLEPLRGIQWVRVTHYLDTPEDEKDGIVFAQKSWYLDSNGKRWGVDDVWFPAQ